MCDTWKNWSHLEKWVTFGKMGHTWKKWVKWTNGIHLEKWVTIGRMCHTWLYGSYL